MWSEVTVLPNKANDKSETSENLAVYTTYGSLGIGYYKFYGELTQRWVCCFDVDREEYITHWAYLPE